MQISLQIQNGNQQIFNALKAFLKSHSGLDFEIVKTNKKIHYLSEADEADFQETLRLLEKGELKFISADEAKRRTSEHLQKLLSGKK